MKKTGVWQQALNRNLVEPNSDQRSCSSQIYCVIYCRTFLLLDITSKISIRLDVLIIYQFPAGNWHHFFNSNDSFHQTVL